MDAAGRIEATVRQVIDAHPAEAASYRGGKVGLAGFFIGEAMRFIYADVFRDADPDKIFSKPPVAGSVRYLSRYLDKDEKSAYTICRIQWQQEISLGAAGREREGDGILLLIQGTDEYAGDPNGDEVPFEVT